MSQVSNFAAKVSNGIPSAGPKSCSQATVRDRKRLIYRYLTEISNLNYILCATKVSLLEHLGI